MAPGGRNENRGGTGHRVGRKGSGIGSGPVGSGGFSGRPGTGSGGFSGGMSGGTPGADKGFTDSAAGKGLLIGGLLYLLLGKGGGGNNGNGGFNLGKLIRIILIVAVVVIVLKACTGGLTSSYESYDYDTSDEVATETISVETQPASQSSDAGLGLLLQQGVNAGTVETGWAEESNSGTLNTETVSGVRSKFYTPAKGDKVTVMLYMIGTDLESSYGMGTSDLSEISKANISDDVNMVVYTGGCKKWQNNVTSNNTVYHVTSKGFEKLGSESARSMTNPEVLAGFINYCTKNYPAERNILILWDHGGGSVTGYGYDEVYASSGSMSLESIGKALKSAGTKFDFIGFDACLMATAENALMLSDYADYMIASEESEPGIGWYYTNWVTALSSNTAIDTVQLGKKIADDFVSTCAQQCRGQDTTLSVTDLAETEYLLPTALQKFYEDTAELVSSDYSSVSKARSAAHEFAKSSKIDQCDLAHLALNMGTESGQSLVKAIKSVVKYNTTGSTVSNAYGLSVYFPYRSNRTVNTAINTLGGIDGIGTNYGKCIEAFATVQASGSYSSFGSGSSYGGLLDVLTSAYGGSGSSSYGGYSSNSYGDDMYSILSALMGGKSIDKTEADKAAAYAENNQLDDAVLHQWKDGKITLNDSQLRLINEILLNVFVNDGEGYIDLGYDLRNGDFCEDGSLNGTFDRYWLSVDDWFACFNLLRRDGSTITGYIPVMYNGKEARLIVRFENSVPSVVGIETDYSKTGETATVSKTVVNADEDGNVTVLKEGDVIELLADYYSRSGEYQDSYRISDPITVGADGALDIKDDRFDDAERISACFRITDIYGQIHWTAELN